MDIYLVNSGKCDFYDPSPPLRNALYRNNRDGSFTDVTEKAGVGAGGYGQGVPFGDYDADGFPDSMLRNTGRTSSITITETALLPMSEKAGVAATGWSSSAVWFDYGQWTARLDLFVCRFVDF